MQLKKFASLSNFNDGNSLITLAASSGKSSVTVWRPSVCYVGILTITHKGAARDAASVHFGPETDPTYLLFACCMKICIDS